MAGLVPADKMKKLIIIPAIFIFLLSIVYGAGGWDEGGWDEGSWDFGTPEPEPESQPSASSGGGGGGGGGGRLFDGIRNKFDTGSRTEIIKYGDAFQFYIDNKRYTSVILRVNQNDNTIKIRITPTFNEYTIKAQNSILVDVNNDNEADLRITLFSINKLGGTFTFTILEEVISSGGSAGTLKKITFDDPEPKGGGEPLTCDTYDFENQCLDSILGNCIWKNNECVKDTEPPKSPDYIPPKEKEKPSNTIAWIIAMIVIILGIVLIVAYKKNKDEAMQNE